MYPTAFPNCLEQSSNKAGMAQRTRRSSPIASPPVPPMTKILMMKMSNSFVRGSSRRPVSAFLLRRISRAIMQYQHAGSAFYKWPFQSHHRQYQIQSKRQQNRGNPHRHIGVECCGIFCAISLCQHHKIAVTVQENGCEVTKYPNTKSATG